MQGWPCQSYLVLDADIETGGYIHLEAHELVPPCSHEARLCRDLMTGFIPCYSLFLVVLSRTANTRTTPQISAIPPRIGGTRFIFCGSRVSCTMNRIGDAKYARESTPRPIKIGPTMVANLMRHPRCFANRLISFALHSPFGICCERVFLARLFPAQTHRSDGPHPRQSALLYK